MESEPEPVAVRPASGELSFSDNDSVAVGIGEDPGGRMMDPKQITEARWRADDKIEYARLMLQELLCSSTDDRDFIRTHEEGVLFHLMGALDAFTEELNLYYGCGLRKSPKSTISRGGLRKALESKRNRSKELAEITTLEKDDTSWLSNAEKIRHHSTHVWGTPRTDYHGGARDGETRLKNPETLVEVDLPIFPAFSGWIIQMESLLERLRISAVDANKDSLFPGK